MAVVNDPVSLARMLGDPLRLRILEHLMGGSATVSELVARCGATQSNVSNHLALLRDGSLLSATRIGRHITYEIADSSIAALIEALFVASGEDRVADAVTHTPAIALARTCYDHIAGKLGVALFESLVERGALEKPERALTGRKVRSGLGNVCLGEHAAHVFEELGIDVELVLTQTRQFATACNDWTESRPHLGGALGTAVWNRMRSLRWVARRPNTRAVTVTTVGRAELARRFGIELPA